MNNAKAKHYIGIDGGGTKTKFLVARVEEDVADAIAGGSLIEAAVSEEGASGVTEAGASGNDGPADAIPGVEIIGEYTGTGCHYMQIGFERLGTLIAEGLDAACVNAGIKRSDVDFAFGGLAGCYDLISDQPMIDRALKSAFGDMPFAAENDCANALEGALAGRPGINIVAGTGSIGSGRNAAGRFMRCGGWHYILGGDEGSAYWIAWNLLKEYSRQSDGRDKKTALYDAVNEALNLRSDDEMITRVVNEWNLDRARIAGLAPIVSKLCYEGDPSAKAILDGCARELADFAIVLHRELEFEAASGGASEDSAPTPVSGTGGVFRIGPAVTEPFDQIIRRHGMKYVKPMYTPDMGALLLAIKQEKLQSGR